jgi:hypothetical protein
MKDEAARHRDSRRPVVAGQLVVASMKGAPMGVATTDEDGKRLFKVVPQ